NPLEWLLYDEPGEEDRLMEFDTEEEARRYLLDNGEDPEAVEDAYVYRHSIGKCCKCGSFLYPSQVEGYVSQCFTCDEDFYGFEQETDCYVGLSRHDFAQMVFNSRETKESFSIYAEYDPESDTAQWAYEIRVTDFADSTMVIGNYWGGGQPFCDDITDDSDCSGLESLLKRWLDEAGFGETVWLKNYREKL
ncbi:MAG: hypothetical protein IJ443_05035, partial [Firmicutes bacterium]|nr:hypothetical protein [Bacillota bacterium]